MKTVGVLVLGASLDRRRRDSKSADPRQMSVPGLPDVPNQARPGIGGYSLESGM